MKKSIFALWIAAAPLPASAAVELAYRKHGARADVMSARADVMSARAARCALRVRASARSSLMLACVHYQKHSDRGCWRRRCRTRTLRLFTCTLRSAEQRVKTITPGEVKFNTQVALQLTDHIIQEFEGCHELSRSALQTFELNQHRTAFACLFTFITGTLT
jgi:hypothetical protein